MAKRQITDQAELEQVLKQADHLHLAMWDGEYPSVIPMNFGYEDKTLYLHTGLKGGKLDLLRKNPKVGFQAMTDLALLKPEDESLACSFSVRYRSVGGKGIAEVVTDSEEVEQGLRVIAAKYSDKEPQFKEKALAKTVIIRIRVQSLTGKANRVE